MPFENRALDKLIRAIHELLARFITESTPQGQVDREVSNTVDAWKLEFPEYDREDFSVTMKIQETTAIKVKYSDPLMMEIDNAREKLMRTWSASEE